MNPRYASRTGGETAIERAMLGTRPSLAFTASSSSLARPWTACGLTGVMRSMCGLLMRATTGLQTDRSVYKDRKKRSRLHGLLLGQQLQGGVTGHVGGVRVALDHGGYDGPFD